MTNVLYEKEDELRLRKVDHFSLYIYTQDADEPAAPLNARNANRIMNLLPRLSRQYNFCICGGLRFSSSQETQCWQKQEEPTSNCEAKIL